MPTIDPYLTYDLLVFMKSKMKFFWTRPHAPDLHVIDYVHVNHFVLRMSNTIKSKVTFCEQSRQRIDHLKLVWIMNEVMNKLKLKVWALLLSWDMQRSGWVIRC